MATAPARTADLTLRRARPEEADALTALALGSKRVWGYDESFMARARAELTVTATMIAAHPTTVCERESNPVGFYMLAITGRLAEVELFFVAPGAIRSGVGRALWRRLVADAVEHGAEAIGISADPSAEGFYRAMGAVRTGSVESGSIPGRSLPRLAFRIERSDPSASREVSNA